MYTSNMPNKRDYYPVMKPSNRPESDLQSSRDRLRLYVIPAWIQKSFMRKYSLTEIHDYSKLRQVASLNDIASMLVVNDWLFREPEIRNGTRIEIYSTQFFNMGVDMSSPSDCMNAPVLTDEEYTEYRSSIVPCLNDAMFRSSVMARFRVPEGEPGQLSADATCHSVFDVKHRTIGADPAELGFRVESASDSLYIFVEEGFLSRVATDAARLSFFQQVLKAAYAVLPIKAVNQTEWYRSYVHALSKADA